MIIRLILFTFISLIIMASSTGIYALDPAAGYAGSIRCSVCHPQIFEQWKTTLHSDIYKSPVPENMIANWTGEVILSNPSLNIPPTSFTLNNNGGNGPFTVSFLGQSFTVDRIHGGRPVDSNEDPNNPGKAGSSKYIGKQRYHTKMSNNFMILPLQWNPVPNLDGKNGGWVPYNLEDWVTPAGILEPKVVTRAEENNCAGCHQTGVQVSFNEAIQRYELGRIEENIACEACHGPGEQHASTANSNLIINPSKLTAIQQQMDVCGQCHTRVKSKELVGGRNLGFPYNIRNMRPGDILEDFANPASGLWQGGISKQHHQQREDYIGHDNFEGSAHAKAGLTCFSCHNAHGSENEHDLIATARDNTLCLNCHKEKFPNTNSIALHSQHAVDIAGAPRCVDCHMSATQKSAVDFDIHQHNFKVLTPAQTLEFAQPNACAMCHRSYQGTVDKNIAVWNEDSDIIINTWLNEQFQAMFVSSGIPSWEKYN